MQYTFTRSGDIQVAVPCELVASVESSHQEINIIDTDAWGRCLILDGVVNTSSKYNAAIHESLYAVPYEVCKPTSVLILGGGDLLGAKMCLDLGLKHVSVVELDPAVVELSLQHLHDDTGFVDDHRLEIRYADAAQFVAEHKQRYDMIIVDMTDPQGISSAVYSSQFMANTRELVDGLLCSQCDSPETIGDSYFSLVNRYRAVFEHVRPFRVWIPPYLELFGRLLASRHEFELPTKIGNYSWLTADLLQAMFGMFSKGEERRLSLEHEFEEQSSVRRWSIG